MYFDALTAPDTGTRHHARAAARSAAKPRRKILVAFDGSPAACCALDYAIEQARGTNASIHAVNVQEAFVDDVLRYRVHQHEGGQILKSAIARLDASGVSHATEVTFGTAAESIVRTATMEGSDLIVVGTRDRLAVASFFSPSVSSQVVRLSRVPVTVIRQKVSATTHSPRNISVAAWRPRP